MGARCCCCFHVYDDYTSHIETYNTPYSLPISQQYGYDPANYTTHCTPRIMHENDHTGLLHNNNNNNSSSNGGIPSYRDNVHHDDIVHAHDFDSELDDSIDVPMAQNLTEEQIQILIQKQVARLSARLNALDEELTERESRVSDDEHEQNHSHNHGGRNHIHTAHNQLSSRQHIPHQAAISTSTSSISSSSSSSSSKHVSSSTSASNPFHTSTHIHIKHPNRASKVKSASIHPIASPVMSSSILVTGTGSKGQSSSTPFSSTYYPDDINDIDIDTPNYSSTNSKAPLHIM